jgi:hypothetical protein
MNQLFRLFSNRYELCLYSFSKERRFFENSRISQNDSDQIRANRSIHTNERRTDVENSIRKFHENARNQHEAIRLVHVSSER